jgi:hypothetical protein
MKLVSSDDTDKRNSDEFYKLYKHSSPTKLKRMTDLDTEINDILATPIDLETKAKLYSQALRKFLSYKKQHLEDTVFDGLEKKSHKKKSSKTFKPSAKKKSSIKKNKINKNITIPKILSTARITPKKKKIKTKQTKAPKKGKPQTITLSSDEEIGQTSAFLPKKSKNPKVKKDSSEPSYDKQMEDYLSYIQDGTGWENYETN